MPKDYPAVLLTVDEAMLLVGKFRVGAYYLMPFRLDGSHDCPFDLLLLRPASLIGCEAQISIGDKRNGVRGHELPFSFCGAPESSTRDVNRNIPSGKVAIQAHHVKLIDDGQPNALTAMNRAWRNHSSPRNRRQGKPKKCKTIWPSSTYRGIFSARQGVSKRIPRESVP